MPAAQNPRPAPMTRGERVTRPPRLGRPHGSRRCGLGVVGMLVGLLTVLNANALDQGLQWHNPDGGWTTEFALETEVDFRIQGLLAEVVVTQRFVNQSPEWREGRYLLPLPDDAAVGSLSLRIGERLVEGEVREKQEARRVYEQAAAQGRRAAIVEANRPNLFRTAVANVGPGESVEVRIGYWQPVGYRDGGFSLTLPLTLTPRYLSSTQCAPDCNDPPAALPASGQRRMDSRGLEPIVSIHARIDAGLPLSYVGSPTHAVQVTTDGSGHRVELARLVEASDQDFELHWRPVPNREPQQAVFVESLDDGHYLQLMLLPPTLAVTAVPRELILVIDNSGSMQGERMRQAIAALDEALTRLRRNDRFNVIRFNHTTEALFPEPVPATAENVHRARGFVGGLRATGGTELMGALELAFMGSPPATHLRQVVLATDAAIGNERALFSRIEHERGDARLFPVGIGSAPNNHFLRRSAELGRGTATVIRDTADVAREMARLFDRLDRPAMRDIDIDWPNLADVYPRQIPDLYAGEPLRISARVPVLHGEVGLGGRSPGGEWRRLVDLADARPAPGAARLWASARVQSLEDDLRNGAPEEEVRAQVLATALRHGIASRYTSLVAVERARARPDGQAMDSTAFANAAPADALVFAQGSTGLRRSLGLALALGLIGVALWRRED